MSYIEDEKPFLTDEEFGQVIDELLAVLAEEESHSHSGD